MADYEQLGREAHERGDMRIVPQSILCAGRPAVGEGHEQMENARAWYRGYEAAADAAANALLAAWAEEDRDR
jgi:hypothetical protein